MFVISKLFWWTVQPSRFFVLLVCLAALLLFTKYTNAGRILLVITASSGLLSLLLPVHIWLAVPLEQRFAQPADLPEHVDGILVLGGGVDQILTQLHGQVSLNAAAERMTETFALSRRYPDARVVFSGGTALLNPPDDMKEADTAQAFFEQMGLSEDRFTIESDSRNTFENAVFSQALLQPEDDEVWLLVTSAFHIPRSVGIFRKLGWELIPYPVDYRVGRNAGESNPMFFSEKLNVLDVVLKEWVGLVAYRILGRTTELFPKP